MKIPPITVVYHFNLMLGAIQISFFDREFKNTKPLTITLNEKLREMPGAGLEKDQINSLIKYLQDSLNE